MTNWFAEYPQGEATDPQGPPEGKKRVIRGGCWSYPADGVRSAYRWSDWPNSRTFDPGFRLAKSIAP